MLLLCVNKMTIDKIGSDSRFNLPDAAAYTVRESIFERRVLEAPPFSLKSSKFGVVV
jgi:hypothetical protein